MKRFIATVILLVASLTSCSERSTEPTLSKGEQDAILEVMEKQATAWNSGDIEGYMEAYLKDPELRIASDRGLSRGWTHIMELYASNYPTSEMMGELSYKDIQITPLPPDHAQVFGRYVLSRPEPIPTSTGHYTLLFKKTSDGWRIIHDHSTELAQTVLPEPPKN